ncbi:cytochrome c1 [Methylomicrobium sp. RS1]|jgi:ubiquinol-cytochrome c reductase cytochrome c1 subunit|uniref:cytochrome c1 n=1 Tax=Candidatus Methylomicrobium oryzae TaxID=2802053 RepID=UPI001920C2A0|nr:cytochrome c1 [Methylomicrobium sp. RS1]MBL1262751.1 cytochrome c1 [Methylomicrobium sp. RS1]
MRRIITLLLFCALSVNGYASEGVELQAASIDLSDKQSLQRGAKTFVTYCLGCHSLKYMRYKRLAQDFGLDEKKMLTQIAPQNASIYDKMFTAMNKHDAEKWFGIQPPDLSLIARSRGTDWLYSYLKGFYVDKSKALGVNNAVFPDVGMPNVFWQLQGQQQAVVNMVEGKQIVEGLVLDKPGTLSEKEFDDLVNDLVNFLAYVGEPMQLERVSLGKYVLLYLFMFLGIAYVLKKEYWKDVH